MLKKTTRTLMAAALVAGGLFLGGANTQGGIAGLILPTAAQAQTTSTTQDTAKPADKTQADTKAADALPAVPDISEGDPNAPIHVIEYGAFTCPHCAEFHAAVFPELKKNYIDTGKVLFTYRAFFLQRYGLWADLVARCGGEMKYYGIVDMLFNKQREWAYNSDQQKVIDGLRQIGLTAGLTKDQLDQCLNDGKMAQAMVAKWQKDAKADKIEGTPTFMINGKKYENMSYDAFAKILDGLLKK